MPAWTSWARATPRWARKAFNCGLVITLRRAISSGVNPSRPSISSGLMSGVLDFSRGDPGLREFRVQRGRHGRGIERLAFVGRTNRPAATHKRAASDGRRTATGGGSGLQAVSREARMKARISGQ